MLGLTWEKLIQTHVNGLKDYIKNEIMMHNIKIVDKERFKPKMPEKKDYESSSILLYTK